jgi:cytochrome P450
MSAASSARPSSSSWIVVLRSAVTASIARTTTRDVEIRWRTIPQGRRVMLLYASANRDSREFGNDAEECRIDRKFSRQLAFSFGPHFRLGASAARMQARVTLEELLAACPNFSVDWEACSVTP